MQNSPVKENMVDLINKWSREWILTKQSGMTFLFYEWCTNLI
jgi:hypothetical protein